MHLAVRTGVGVAACVLSACSYASRTTGNDADFGASAIENWDDRSPFLIESDSLEALAIVASGGRVRRDNEGLHLRLADDSVLILTDQNGDAERLIRYRLRPGLRELGYYLVMAHFWEGSEFHLIHEKSGRRLVLDGYEPPVLSPDSLRIVAASGDFEAGYYPNRIQIVGLTSAGPISEWALCTGEYDPPVGWAASGPKWLDERTVELTMQLPDETSSQVGQQVPVWLDFTDEGWQIRTTPRLERETLAGDIATDTSIVSLSPVLSAEFAKDIAVANALVESLALRIDTIVVNPVRIELRVGESFPMPSLHAEAFDSAGFPIRNIPMHYGLKSEIARIAPGFRLEATAAGEAILLVTPLSTRRGARSAQWASTAVTIVVTP